MYSGKRQKSYMPALDGPARAMIQGVGITVKAPPANSTTTGSQSGALAFKHTHTSFQKLLAQLSRHRDIRGRGAYRFPQGVAVATFWYQKTADNKYIRDGEDLPEAEDLPSVDFEAGTDVKFKLHPGDGSVYLMTGSANAFFTHKVTCNQSKSGDWLRVSVPTFVFWSEPECTSTVKAESAEDSFSSTEDEDELATTDDDSDVESFETQTKSRGSCGSDCETAEAEGREAAASSVKAKRKRSAPTATPQRKTTTAQKIKTTTKRGAAKQPTRQSSKRRCK